MFASICGTASCRDYGSQRPQVRLGHPRVEFVLPGMVRCVERGNIRLEASVGREREIHAPVARHTHAVVEDEAHETSDERMGAIFCHVAVN